MTENDFPTEVFEQLAQDSPSTDDFDQDIELDNLPANKRVAVRYRRKDIKAVLKVRSLLFPRLLPILLHDISSKGAGVVCHHKIGINSRVSLYLLFNDGLRFEIECTVVFTKNSRFYGLKFDKYNDNLAEHLYDTQTDLKFN